MTETKEYRMLRIKPETHQDLRVIAALTGESMIDLVERLAREERIKVGRQTDNDLRPVRP
jgi:hypothetical protein